MLSQMKKHLYFVFSAINNIITYHKILAVQIKHTFVDNRVIQMHIAIMFTDYLASNIRGLPAQTISLCSPTPKKKT